MKTMGDILRDALDRVETEGGKKMNECIILERNTCPHEEIDGKTCFYCKIPDEHTFCNVCGRHNTMVEKEHNNGKCYNCNSNL